MLHPEIPRTLLWSPLVTLMIALAPVGANASETAMIRKSVTVRVSDLDLKQPADAAKLYQRIRRAAERACGDGLTGGSPLAQPVDRDCVLNAIAHAVAAVDRPLLTTIYQRTAGAAPARDQA